MKRRLFLAIGLLALCLPLFVSAGSSNYYPHAIGDFDGTNDYLTRGSDLTGNADGKLGLFSCWLRIDGGDGAARNFIGNTGPRFQARLASSNRIQLVGADAGGVNKLVLQSATIYSAGPTWYHIAASWNLATATGRLYVDDADDLVAGATLTDAEIDYTRTDWAIGANQAAVNKWNGAIAELYFTNEFLDISSTANRRFFISASGDPVDLGLDGSLPTGTAPLIYMRERANNAGLNFGTGGDFTINGAPAFTLGPVPFFPLTIEIPARGMGSRMRIH